MSKNPQSPSVYTIPASLSFVDTLAKGLLTEVGDNVENLAHYLLLLPTRRACRSLQDAFLRQTDGRPLLLPRMQTFGDIDEEELFISGQGETDIHIPPAMPPMKRQILLAKTIAKLPHFTKGPEQDMALANALGKLMDQIYTENLELSDLPHIVDREAFAEHWQITLDFLSILSEYWPKVLAEKEMIDSADRRNRLINALNAHWQQTSPDYPIIAAGSTGSIPSTAALLKTISTLPKGSVILPGLDQAMSKKAWKNIKEGHPQTTLKILLHELDCERGDVKIWPTEIGLSDTKKARENLISKIMIPAEQTDEWQKMHFTPLQKQTLEQTCKNIVRYDCASSQEEAQIISILFRETLEEKQQTAALITPDRKLARRVAMACRRWGIEVDDSAGYKLSESQTGSYLSGSANLLINNAKPLVLLNFLKHSKNTGAGYKNFRSLTRELEKNLLRGPAIVGIEGILKKYNNIKNDPESYLNLSDDLKKFIEHLDISISNFANIFSENFHDFSDLLEKHIIFSEKFSDKTLLWSGEEGEAAAHFLSELREYANDLPRVNGKNYLALISQFMSAITIRPKYGTHPRLMILGQLEARLVHADRVILAGLNEGTWPPDPGHDPWMSRPMRKNFGLPAPERSITLAAHDFAQGLCHNNVFITRAEKIDGTPTIAARWLQRLDTFLEAINIDPQIIRSGKHQAYLSFLDKIDNTTPISRPAPTPPVEARPRNLSVTKIEKWMKDPYGIYADKILKLRKLDAIEKIPDAADKGNIVHKIMEKFTETFPKEIHDGAEEQFIQIGHNILQKQSTNPAEWRFWQSRLVSMAQWVISNEKDWRKTAKFTASEVKGEAIFTEQLQKPFTLTARVDRIDTTPDGIAIIDYKSGGTYSISKIQSGELPQLSLEALILSEGGFAPSHISKTETSNLAYWKITGGKDAGDIKELNNSVKIEEAIETTKSGLLHFVQTFDNIDIPYYAIPRLDNAPAYNDYEYLERVKEWAALGDNDSGDIAAWIN